jgi:hypothetical protein
MGVYCASCAREKRVLSLAALKATSTAPAADGMNASVSTNSDLRKAVIVVDLLS